jgi:uncharacterized protein (UPF0332 family)
MAILTSPLHAPITPFFIRHQHYYFRVIANFGKEFARTRAMDPKYHNYLIESQDRRNIGDYSIVAEVTDEQTIEMLGWAKEFVKAAEEYLEE